MKFLLAAINAKYIHSNPGVYSLRAFARTKIPGADIEIGEYTINHQMDLILQDIYRGRRADVHRACACLSSERKNVRTGRIYR